MTRAEDGSVWFCCTECQFEWRESAASVAALAARPVVDPLAKVVGCPVEGGVAVRDYLGQHLTEIDSGVRADIIARLDKGEAKYGTVLKVGWDGAWQELYQELLDGVAYAVSCHGFESLQVARQLGSVAASVRRHMQRATLQPPGVPVIGDELDIKVRTIDGGSSYVRARYVAPGLAVHPSIEDGSKFTITHTHTGGVILDDIPTLPGAMVVADMLYRADWSEPHDGRMETVAARPSVARVYFRAKDFLRRYRPTELPEANDE